MQHQFLLSSALPNCLGYLQMVASLSCFLSFWQIRCSSCSMKMYSKESIPAQDKTMQFIGSRLIKIARNVQLKYTELERTIQAFIFIPLLSTKIKILACDNSGLIPLIKHLNYPRSFSLGLGLVGTVQRGKCWHLRLKCSNWYFSYRLEIWRLGVLVPILGTIG